MMGVLLGFAPFLLFMVMVRVAGTTAALITAAVISGLLFARDLMAGKSAKVLELGTLILFVGLTLYAILAHPVWTVIAVKLWVDGGLLLIVLASLAIRKPFTLQYAREQVPAEFWNSPRFIRINYIITAVWAAAFLIVVLAEAVVVYVPSTPSAVAWIGTLAVCGALYFTKQYPEQARRRLRDAM